MSFGNKSLVIILFMLVMAVSFITWLSYHNNKSYQASLVTVNHSHQVLYAVEQLVSSVKDIQLNSNNYVFTNNTNYIEVLDSAILKVNSGLQMVRHLVRDNPSQSQLADSLSFYVEQRITFSQKIIESRQNADISKPLEIIATGQGIDMMEKLLIFVKQIRQTELHLLQQRQNSTNERLDQFNILFYISIAVIFAMTIMTVIITFHNSRLKNKIKAEMKRVTDLNKHLEKSGRRFKGLIENGYDAISLLNAEIKPIYRSPAAERITGWSNEERTRLVGIEKTHPEDKENFEETVRQVLENPGKQFEVTLRTQHKNGHYIWLEGIMKNMLHDDSLQGIVSNFRDVSERKKTDIQRTLYESIIQYSEDAIISKSLDGLIFTWNRGAESLFGYKAEEVIGKTFAMFTPDDLIDEELEIIRKVQSGIPVENYETDRITKYGKRFNVSLTASPLIDLQGKMVGTSQIVRDITERKDAEEKIHRLKIELEHKVILRTKELAQVNRELKAVSYYISKGVYAPLWLIKKNTFALHEQLQNEYDKMKLVDIIGSNTDEALKLIEELIQFSEVSQQKLNKTYIDMNHLVEQYQQDLPVEVREKIIVANKLHPIMGDPDLLKKLFSNLFGIWLRANLGSDTSRIEIRSAVNQEHVSYSIFDPDSDIFDSILNTSNFTEDIDGDQSVEENFVSLLIIRHIVLKHEGDLKTQVVEGKGSSVTFYIPVNNWNRP